MKKRNLNHETLDKVFPKASETFEQETMHMLHGLSFQEETAPRARKRAPALLLTLALVLLLATTGLAVAHRLGLVDLFGIGRVNPEEAATVIQTDILGQGGHAEGATFAVRESFYDGTFLRFVVDATPDDGIVLLDHSFAQYAESPETSGLEGTRYAVDAIGRLDDFDLPFELYARQEGTGLMLCASVFLPSDEQCPEILSVSMTFDVINMDDASVHDSTELVVNIPRTAKPSTQHAAVNASMDFVEIAEVSTARTPLETIVEVRYKPLLRAFTGFRVVMPDGYLRKDGLPRYYGEYGFFFELVDGYATSQYIMPAELGETDVLTLWPMGSTQVIQIDLSTGESIVKDAAIITEGENTRIEMEDENK